MPEGSPLEAEIRVKFNDQGAVGKMARYSQDLVKQQENVRKATQASKVSVEQLNAALGKSGAGDVAKKLTAQVALTKEEYGKVRRAITEAIKEQEKFVALTEKQAKRVEEIRQRAKARADVITEAQKERKSFEEQEKRATALYRAQLTQREQSVRRLQRVTEDSVNASVALQNKLTAAVKATNLAYQRSQMVAGGMSASQALQQQIANAALQNQFSIPPQFSVARPNASQWQQQMQRAIFQSNAGYLGGMQPPPVAGGGGKGLGGILGMLGFGGGGGMAGGLIRNALGGLGIGAGMYGVVNTVNAIKSSTEQATAYDRMEVSARKLAGSQAELNRLLEAYQEASGQAASQVTALENVVRLQATGFAESAEMVERFVRGARGASLALGKPQDFIIQETQLAVSNTSFKRLDQIGLGIGEVRDRMEELRKSNKDLNREMAFQEAVIGLLNEKYGVLSDSAEGQKTGLEEMGKAFSDVGLVIGQAFQGPVNAAAKGIAFFLNAYKDAMTQALRLTSELHDAWIEFSRDLPGALPNILPGGNLTSRERQTLGSRTSITRPIREERIVGRNLDEDQLAATMEWSAARQRIERETSASLLSEHRSYVREYRQVQEDFQTSLIREEEDFNRARARQAASTARQIAEVHEEAAKREERAAKDLAKSLGDLDRDFQRQQAIQERDLNRSIEQNRVDHAERVRELEEDYSLRIEESREDSLQRLADMQTEHDERVAEAREDSTKRLTEMNEDFNKSQEQALKQHNRTVAEAAAALDARAVFFEERRFKEEQEEARKAHEEAIAEEQKRLAEFEAEANKDHQKAITKEQERQTEFEEEANAAHQKQLEREAKQLAARESQEREAAQQRTADALEALEQQRTDLLAAFEQRKEDAAQADADRLEDINEAIALQQTAEDEDRRIRLERLASDHTKQLAEMTSVHNERIQQIKDHAKLERDQLDTEFQATLAQLGLETDAYATEYEELKNIAIKHFDEFMIHVSKELEKKTTGKAPSANTNQGRIDELTAERGTWVALRDTLANNGQIGTPEWLNAVGNINRIDQEINRLRREGTSGPSASASAFASGAVTPAVAGVPAMMGGSSSIVIASGAVQITALPGQTPAVLGEEFERRLLAVVQRVARAQ